MVHLEKQLTNVKMVHDEIRYVNVLEYVLLLYIIDIYNQIKVLYQVLQKNHLYNQHQL
jgi:hypothetical protein